MGKTEHRIADHRASAGRHVAGTVAFVLAALVALSLPGTAPATEAAPPSGQPIPGRYIVMLQPGVTAQDVARDHGLAPSIAYQHAISGFATALSPRQASALRADARVAVVEPDRFVSIAEQGIPTGIRRAFADENASIDIDGADDWRVDVDIAVIDTGIDAGHPDLNVVSSTDCRNESGGPPWSRTVSCGSGGNDDNGHGTHVAGTAAALDNDLGVVGIAPGARLWAVKVLGQNGSGSLSHVIAGIDYVTANASEIDVANMSLGCECSSAAMDSAIASSVAAGVTYAVSAGNDGRDAETYSPANHPDVITVSALADFDGEPGGLGAPTCRSDQDDTLAGFSNYGSTIDIAAPGVCIRSTVPGGYATYSGTSMASPHVAGAAALLASTGMSPANVRATLLSTGNADWTDDSGDGVKEPLLDVSSSAFSPALEPGGGSSGDALPQVSITSPTSGSTVTGTVTVTADASDDAGVTQVEFLVDGTSIGVDSDDADGWSASWDSTSASDGSHTLSAVATDTAAQTASHSVTVTVSNTSELVSTLSVSSAAFTTTGGRDGNKHVNLDVAVVDENGSPVAGATIDVVILLDGAPYASGSATTDGSGAVQFSAKNAPSGTYTSTGTVTHGQLVWDGAWPGETLVK